MRDIDPLPLPLPPPAAPLPAEGEDRFALLRDPEEPETPRRGEAEEEEEEEEEEEAFGAACPGFGLIFWTDRLGFAAGIDDGCAGDAEAAGGGLPGATLSTGRVERAGGLGGRGEEGWGASGVASLVAMLR